jgi:hypothetical protein
MLRGSARTSVPEAKRFWSVTAYTPDAIELVANPVDKYVVASYTRGLEYHADGSLSVYLARELPAGVPFANSLSLPQGMFNIMLRVDGPEGRSQTTLSASGGPQTVSAQRRCALEALQAPSLGSG